MAFTGPTEGADMDRVPDAHAQQGQGFQGPAGHLAADGYGFPAARQRLTSQRRKLSMPRRQHVIAVGDARVAAIDGEHELGQVVAADRQEVDPLQQRVHLPGQGRHFEHGADLDGRGRFAPGFGTAGQLHVEQGARLNELGHFRDHRKHHMQIAAGGGGHKRAQRWRSTAAGQA